MAIVEFTLVLPVLLLVLFAVVDFGKAFNYWIDETHLANEGARLVVVNKDVGGDLATYLKNQADTEELKNGMSVSISFPNGSCNVGDPVKVAVSYAYNWLPMIGSAAGTPTTTLNGSSTMRLEQKPTNFGCA